MSLNMTPNASWAKRSKRTASGEPRLHPVLESMVLSSFEHNCNPHDLTWLWVGGRHVSKHFRCEVERIFRTVLLPEAILRCNMGKLLRRGPLSRVGFGMLGER